MKKNTKYTFKLGSGREVTFTRRTTRLYWHDFIIALVNGEVKINDGTVYDAVLEISFQDGGEHCGTHILLEDRIASQGDPKFLEHLGKRKKDVFPYTYMYRLPKKYKHLRERDHHIDPETHWSRV